MKDAIIIRVQENDEAISIGVETDVHITNRARYSIINALMQSLEVDIDWLSVYEVNDFAGKMWIAKLEAGTPREATTE